jgi:hypothetical protein
MTEPSHDALDRHVNETRERLLAKLDVLDQRARSMVREATTTTRATVIGLAGALALSFSLALAERANQRLRHPHAPRRSILGDALRVGAVAVMFVAVSGWAKRQAHAQPRRASQPQLRRIASHDSMMPRSEAASAPHSGTSHALPAQAISTESSPLDTERFPHD